MQIILHFTKMEYRTVFIVILNTVLVLATAMESFVHHDKTRELEELLEEDDLLPINRSIKTRMNVPKIPTVFVPERPRMTLTSEQRSPEGLRLLLEVDEEDELLFPSENTLLSRHRRQVEGSGVDLGVDGAITLQESLPANPNTRVAETEAQLQQEFADNDVSVDSVLVAEPTNVDGNSRYVITVNFLDVTDRRSVAYVLVRIHRRGSLGRVNVVTQPTVVNAAGVELPTASSQNPFPFGQSEVDFKLRKLGVDSQVAVTMPDGFPYYDQLIHTFYIGDNGGVSLDKSYNPYNLAFLQDAVVDHLCIYCTDFDIRYGGDVYYQTYTAGDTTSDAMLTRAAEEVRARTTHSTFTPSWTMVVTWYNVPEFVSFSATSADIKRNTFQMVLMTDNRVSYMMFYYSDIQASDLFRGTGVHGYRRFSPSDLNRLLYSSWNSIAGGAVKPFLHQTAGNTLNQAGVWIFKIGDLGFSNDHNLCYAWYWNNVAQRDYFQTRGSELGTGNCPCSRDLVWTTAAFLPASLFTGQSVYCVEIRTSNRDDSYDCCYDSVGRFIDNLPDGGSYLRYSKHRLPDAHRIQDTSAKNWCCRNTNLCRIYRQLRPPTTCLVQGLRGVQLILFGDPHFATLDGKFFTFNGIGEYQLINLQLADQSLSFQLQCRTIQATTSSGSSAPATVFSAFAAQQDSSTLGSGRIHAELNPDKTQMVIYIDDKDVTIQFYSQPDFQWLSPDLTASRLSETTIEFAFTKSGISVTISFISGTLSQATILPEIYKGLPTGMLGNWNGNDQDDFRTPTGIQYSSTFSDRELYPFGQSWVVTDQASSVFHYGPGETKDIFFDAAFTPFFSDQITADDRSTAEGVCGAGNEQCIFDYVVTKDTTLALSATTQLAEAANTNSLLENRDPTLTGTSVVDIEVGKTTDLTFVGDDPDGDTVTYIVVEGPSSGLTFNPSTGTGNWTVTNTSPVKIRLAAEDSRGAQSPVLDVQVRLCAGCGGNGRCDYETPISAPASETDSFFQTVSCLCDTGYSGVDCTQDKNGCLNEPCGKGRTCTDVNATEEAATGTAFICSPCLSGYEPNSAETNAVCKNINECSTNGGQGDCPANSVCSDTIGSYTCTCLIGFRMNSAGICVDIDECLELTYDCSQTCNNTEGSFTCGCYPGFSLDADGKTCNQTVVPGDCSSLTCSDECGDDGAGGAVCRCRDGYKLDANGTTCIDVNECDLNLCAQICNNSVGSYSCSCYAGFQLAADKLDCDKCGGLNWGLNCSETCECSGRSSGCNSVHGCQCDAGWSGADCGINVNECELDKTICSNKQICSDTNGSYVCDCPSGYERNGTDCLDVDECIEQTHNCPENSQCKNLDGTFECLCNTGFKKSGSTCVDIDECLSGVADCQHMCKNTVGSFNCYCNEGYIINNDRRTCTLVSSPCAGLTNLVCSHSCVLTAGLPTCQCDRGYTLAADQTSCIDTNECENTTLNKCTDKTRCTNTLGSYTCSCPAGQVLLNDGRTCIECSENFWGDNCTNECGCSPLGAELCDKSTGCKCNFGWTGVKCNLDINECSSATCPQNSNCVNLPGSYLCTCFTGYNKSADGSTCQEVDECLGDNNCDHECHNTPGSYYCSCRSGFLLSGQGSCVDIDECSLGITGCSQMCRNTQGGFACECFPGFELDRVGRKLCSPQTDATNCTRTDCDQSRGGCRVESGVDTCYCGTGFNLNVDGKTCDDIQECDLVPSRCSQGCMNTVGSFQCTCDPGYSLAVDRVTCEVCVEGQWGENCTSTCNCSPTNTVSCNAVNGTCSCRDGWTGPTCTKDVLECTNKPDICRQNGVCIEQEGSYSCSCRPGFIRANDICSTCTSTTYGTNCANNCSCVFANTVSCDSVSGMCTCIPGWTGSICDTNLNECNSVPAVCAGLHEACRDTPGSFDCDCTQGYQRVQENTACTDINECLLTSLNTCNYICNNNDGSYVCSCPRGYLGTGNDCTENFVEYIAILTLNITQDNIVNNPALPEYKKLQDDIGLGVDEAVASTVGAAYLPTVVVKLESGSIKAKLSQKFDKSRSDQPDSLLAVFLEKIADVERITVDINIINILGVEYKIYNITKEHTLCDVYRFVHNFTKDEYCVVENGIPVAKELEPSETNIGLIIGLSVSLGILLVLLILFIVCICRRRRSKSSTTPSVDRVAFATAFAGRVPTKNNFGPSRYMMYSPHSLSGQSSESSDTISDRRRGRRGGSSGFSDMAGWTDRGRRQLPQEPERHRPSVYRDQPEPSYSWEHLFNVLEPLRNKQFEMPRPRVENLPNPTYEDSLA